jgi:hypothetical protein
LCAGTANKFSRTFFLVNFGAAAPPGVLLGVP